MKTFGWTILVIIFIILAMLILTVVSQSDLLQTRVQQGIGSQVNNEDFVP